MLTDIHPAEFEIITRAFAASSLTKIYPEVKAEVRNYVRQVTQYLMDHATIIAQHCYRTTFRPRDLEHAFTVLWESTNGLCAELSILHFPHLSDKQTDIDDNYDYESDESEAEYNEYDDEESTDDDEEEASQDQSPQFGELGADVFLTDSPFSDLTPSSHHEDDIFLQAICDFLQTYYKNMPVSKEVADVYLTIIVEQVKLSLMSQPCLFSRMGGVSLGLLQAMYEKIDEGKEQVHTHTHSSSSLPEQEDLANSNRQMYQALQEVLVTVRALRTSSLNTPLQSTASQPLPSQPPSESDAIRALSSELSKSAEKITELKQKLAKVEQMNDNLLAKDHKVREVTQTLSNIVGLDAQAVGAVRELSNQARRESYGSYTEEDVDITTMMFGHQSSSSRRPHEEDNNKLRETFAEDYEGSEEDVEEANENKSPSKRVREQEEEDTAEEERGRRSRRRLDR